MKASDLMDAIGQASDERILEVVSHMEKNIKPMKPKRKIYHTILIAAVLVALFTTTAFATGFFGLEAVLIPGSQSAGDGDEAETSAMLSFSLTGKFHGLDRALPCREGGAEPDTGGGIRQAVF